MMLAFLTNKVPFFQLYLKYFVFLTQIMKKYAIFVIPTKNKVIYDTNEHAKLCAKFKPLEQHN